MNNYLFVRGDLGNLNSHYLKYRYYAVLIKLLIIKLISQNLISKCKTGVFDNGNICTKTCKKSDVFFCIVIIKKNQIRF